MNIIAVVMNVFQGAVLLLAAPGVVGVLRFIKARMQGRPRLVGFVVQPYRDLLKLVRRPAVRAGPTSWAFAITPIVLVTAYGSLAYMTPVFQRETLLAGDLIVVVYIFGLARFSLSLAGLDAGAPFGGLGSSREMFQHFLTEIGLILFVIALALQRDTVSLRDVVERSQTEGLALFLEHPNFILLAASLGLLILFEGGRIPIDNPATHLELTMANKAITLEFAGRDLALIEWAEMIKMTFLFVLFGDLFLPVLPLPGSILADEGWRAGGLSVLLLVGKVLALVIVLAVWELGQPKLRLRAVLIPALVAIALSVVAIIYGFLTTALPTVGAQL